jgi:hypothetical protein
MGPTVQQPPFLMPHLSQQEELSPPPVSEETFTQVQVDELDKLLSNLTGSKDSIKRAKNWVFENNRHFLPIVRRMVLCINQETDIKRKLYIIYLISDCLHHSLKFRTEGRLDEFSQAVIEQLANILRPAYLDQDEDVRSKISKVLSLWEERHIFDSKVLKMIENSLSKHSEDSSNSESNPSPNEKIDIPPANHPVVNTPLTSPQSPVTMVGNPPLLVPVGHPLIPVGLPHVISGEFPPKFIPPAPPVDPNCNLPVGILVEHFKKSSPLAPYEPLDSTTINTDVLPIAPDMEILARFDEFLRGLPK